MAIDENTRLDLRNRLAEVLGPHLASAAMEAMPPIDYTSLARTTDLDALGREFRGDMAELRAELRGDMAGLRAEMRGDMAELRGEMRGDMAELRGEMVRLHGQSQVTQASMMRTIILTQLASVIAVAGFAAGLG